MYKRGDSWYSDFWYDGERYSKSHGEVSKTIAPDYDIQKSVGKDHFRKMIAPIEWEAMSS